MFESTHATAMVDMLYNLIKKRPEDKTIVFSQYLRYLDIINKELRMRYKVECLRFDGTVLPKYREVPDSHREEILGKLRVPDSAHHRRVR